MGKAAILLGRLARNHPLPDGNKRTAFFVAGLFLEANGLSLHGAEPDVDVPMVERIAAGDVEQGEIVAWLSMRTAEQLDESVERGLGDRKMAAEAPETA